MDDDSADESITASNPDIEAAVGLSNNKDYESTPSTSQQHYKPDNKYQVEEHVTCKTESKATPRRIPQSNSKGSSKHKQPETQSTSRQCEQHTFLTDITEVRQMEQGLLKLLDDFHLGKLQAFGKDCTFEKMEQVREQQEKLARVHFELNAQQEMYGPQSDDGRRVGRENLKKLIENLQKLSHTIEQLQISNSTMQTDV